MALTKYTYSVSNDITAQAVDVTHLSSEISASSITHAVDSITVNADVLDIWFKDALSEAEGTTLDGLVSAHDGEPLPQNIPLPVQLYVNATQKASVLADGRLRIAAEKSTAERVTIFSHDWTDPTTWYTNSIRVVEEVADDSGDHTTYTLNHGNVIDTFHGKISQEDFLKDTNNYSYRVTVTVDTVEKDEVDPHTTTGDYTVNYDDGEITFGSAQSAQAVVKVTYHYATDSEFVIKPAANMELSIDFAEVQFSEDIALTDSVVFQAKGYVDIFAPQLLQSNGGPHASHTLIPLGDPIVYKAMKDYMNDAVRSYVSYPSLGGVSWRGLNKAIYVFDWDYVSAVILHANHGMCISVKLEHDVPFGGTYATATFYCLTEQGDG